MKTHYQTSYSLDGKTWLGFLSRHATQEEAEEYARSKRNEEIETRVTKVTTEVLSRFEKIPGKKAPPIIVPGLGVIA